MLCESGPSWTPRSSSSPSTSSTNCSPRSRQASAASDSRPSRCASRVVSVRNGGSCRPSSASNCSRRLSMKATRSFWLASRAVMKNETTRTPAGGCNTNQDNNADLPDHAPARHHWYCPAVEGDMQNSASSASSTSRSSSSAGAIRCTCWRYRVVTGVPVCRLTSPRTTPETATPAGALAAPLPAFVSLRIRSFIPVLSPVERPTRRLPRPTPSRHPFA
ncbi:hypothetical protein KIPE111705_33510 [Kibdelosporangium persicum]